MPGARRRGRQRTAWMDNIKTWTGLHVEESIRMTEINGESTSMVWPTVGSRTAEERNVDHGHRSVGTESEGEVTGLRGTVPRSTDGSLLFYMLLWIVCVCVCSGHVATLCSSSTSSLTRRAFTTALRCTTSRQCLSHCSTKASRRARTYRNWKRSALC